MQFQVPQFLDVEDKVIGPLTIKQFLYLAGNVGLGYLSYRYVPYVGLFLGFGFLGFGAALGFYKPNKKPFVFMLESAFNYIKSARLYVWKRSSKKQMQTEFDLSNFQTTKHEGGLPLAKTGNKLNDLSWSMDVETKVIPVEDKHLESAVI